VADPTVVTATVVSSTEVDLNWTDVSTESGYRIERSLDGVTWSGIDTVGQDVTTYKDTGVAAGTSYWYRVIATNAAGDSAPSNIEAVSTPADATTPSDAPPGSPVG
jgi:titin